MGTGKSTESARSWFCVWNNPQKQLGDIEPNDMVQTAIELWCENKPYRACAINYEVGDEGTPHMHMVLEDPEKSRFSAVQKLYQGIHISVTRGSKEQAEDYINKRGRFEEKQHTVVVPAIYRGVIKANRGTRNDLDIIKELVEQGLTPNQIMDKNIHFRKNSEIIVAEYFRKRNLETPMQREVKVVWHVGESGSGKSYTSIKLGEIHGNENIYMYTDYSKGGFDKYCGEEILFIDEFKGDITFRTLLGLLDGYKIQLSCRYTNKYAFWNEVHLTSVFPPETAHEIMVGRENKKIDKLEQLLRRIDIVAYHYLKDSKAKGDKKYGVYEMSGEEYQDYESLKSQALGDEHGFRKVSKSDEVPFN